MAKRAAKKQISKVSDISSWNFVLFLTLSFILIVVVLTAMKSTAKDLSAKAGITCRDVSKSLPRPEDCPGGKWAYERDVNGCPTFVCR